jgi:hypothetical protein
MNIPTRERKLISTPHTTSQTVNWGWQSFAKRNTLYYNAPSAVRESDSFIITCTVSANSGPPAGAWLGYNISNSTWQTDPGSPGYTYAPKGFEASGSGWRGSEGGWKGVGGGNGAMGGERKVVPKELVDAVARTFDREVYSDVEFVLPERKRRKVIVAGRNSTPPQDVTRAGAGTGSNTLAGHVSTDAGMNLNILSSSPSATFGMPGQGHTLGEATPPTETREEAQAKAQGDKGYKTIWANKEFLRRSEYFESMLEGGFSETAGVASVSLLARGTVRCR